MAILNLIQTEPGTIVLMPFGADVRDWRFPVNPQPPIKTGRTKVFPTRATIGPTNADRDDTLFTFNVEESSGGIGVWNINPTQDAAKFWWGVAGTEGTDGMTAARQTIVRQPTGWTPGGGNCIPIGQIGESVYALWGVKLYLWDPIDTTWEYTTKDLPFAVPEGSYEGIVTFEEKMFFPLGANGYAYVNELSKGVLNTVTHVAGDATPAWTAPPVEETEDPCVLTFCVHENLLYALTTEAQGYCLVDSVTGNTADWAWDQYADTVRGKRINIQKSFKPHMMAEFPNTQQGKSLWVSGRGGLMVWSKDAMAFIPTTLIDVPPHPDFGVAMKQFRPGEALWITGGGGDLIQYTSGGATVPASGPGGANEGMPVNARGSVISMASDLYRLYGLIRGEPGEEQDIDITEDSEGGDPIYAPGPISQTTVIGWTGKGWHPQWETSLGAVNAEGTTVSVDGGDTPTRIVVAFMEREDGKIDYRVFWGIGEYCYSMTCRLSTHSSRQAIQRRTGEKFAYLSYIEWGRFSAGSISNNKLASHVALLMEHASDTDYVEYQYYTDRQPFDPPTPAAASQEPWIVLGRAASDADTSPNDPRIVIPFGMMAINGEPRPTLTEDVAFSQGESLRWIRQRLAFYTNNPERPAIVTALTLAFLPQPQDAATKAYTVPLPVDICPRTGQTAVQIVNKIESLLSPEEGDERFLLLQEGQRRYRAYISSVSYAQVPSTDGPGALNVTVIQIPTGRPGLIGEVDPLDIDNP